MCSSDESVKSSTERCGEEFLEDRHEIGLHFSGKDGSFPMMFADLFKAKSNSQGDGSCHFVKPPEEAVLKIVDSNVDNVY